MAIGLDTLQVVTSGRDGGDPDDLNLPRDSFGDTGAPLPMEQDDEKVKENIYGRGGYIDDNDSEGSEESGDDNLMYQKGNGITLGATDVNVGMGYRSGTRL